MDLSQRRDVHNLLFGIRRSIRYHSRRVQFFNRLNVTKSVTSLIFSSTSIITLLQQWNSFYPIFTAAIVALFSAVDLVLNTNKKVRLHEDLIRRFINLEKDIELADNLSEDQLRQFKSKRLDIEADEPPPLRVLDVLCHNELARSMGYGEDQFAKVAWYQRCLAQIVDINSTSIKKVGL
jgi:hypothetical protein